MYRILHVDDEIFESQLFAFQVEKLYPEWQIEWVHSVRDALEVMKSKEFDCIVSDYQMPTSNGLHLLQSLREKNLEIPFIFLTGQGSEAIAAEALRSGATDYFSKSKEVAQYERLTNSIIKGIDQYLGRKKFELVSKDLLEAESSIQEQNETLASIFMAAPLGIGMVVDRVLTQVNRRFCEMVGYSSEELIGQNSRMLYPTEEEYLRTGEEKYRQVRADGVGSVKCTMMRKNGETVEVLLSSSPRDLDDYSKGVTFTTLELPVKF